MRIPFFWLSLGWTLGILAHSFFQIQDEILWKLFGASLFLLWGLRGRRCFCLPLVLAFAFLAILFIRERDFSRQDTVCSWGGKNFSNRIRISGIVKTEPRLKLQGRRSNLSFVLEAREIRIPRGQRHSVTGDVQVFSYQRQSPPFPGDEIEIFGQLQNPRPVLNPGQFDYGAYLKNLNIRCIFTAYGAVRILRPRDGPRRLLAKIRQSAALKIEECFSGQDAEFFKALILGLRDGIHESWVRDFMRTGTSHLLAISGLNIALVAGTSYLFFIFLGLSQKKAALAGFFVTILQVLMAGMGIPVLRAGAMSGVMFFGFLAERQRNGMNTFFFAYWALLAVFPEAFWQISFQLSFLSVFSLIALSYFKPKRLAVEGLGSGMAVCFATFPLLVYHFQNFSLVGIPVNLLAIPLFHLATVAGLLTLSLSPLGWAALLPSQIAAFFLKTALAWIHFWAAPRWSCMVLAKPSAALIGLYYLLPGFVLWARSRANKNLKKMAWRAAAAWLLAVAAFFRPISGETEDFRLTVLAAGQNELAHLKFGTLHWLINTGRTFPTDQADRLVGSYLRHAGIRRLSGILVTDFYKRHTAGLETLSRDFLLDYLIFPEGGEIRIPPAGEACLRHNVRPEEKIFMKGGGEIEILDSDGGKLFLAVRYGERRFLFLSVLNEKIIAGLQKRGGFGPSDIWILPARRDLAVPEMQAFSKIVREAAVVSPSRDPRFQGILENERAKWFDLQTFGALTFTLHSKAAAGSLQICSFLKGEIGN